MKLPKTWSMNNTSWSSNKQTKRLMIYRGGKAVKIPDSLLHRPTIGEVESLKQVERFIEFFFRSRGRRTTQWRWNTMITVFLDPKTGEIQELRTFRPNCNNNASEKWTPSNSAGKSYALPFLNYFLKTRRSCKKENIRRRRNAKVTAACAIRWFASHLHCLGI